MARWPRDNQADLLRFYGTPGPEVERQLVNVVPPFVMYYGDKPIKHIRFHRKAAGALKAALDEIWEHYGRDQDKIDELGISKYAGAYNPRKIRGSTTKWSNHAYAAAIDLNAADNGFGKGKGNIPQPVIDAFKRQGARWGGDYKGRTDPMHFEFCDAGTAKPVSLIDGGGEEFDQERPGLRADGDARLWDTQRQLKLMHYNPGGLDGVWGGGTAGAMTGFLNDRGRTDINAPTSWEEYNDAYEAIDAEIDKAEGETFRRPVTKERAEAQPDTVERVAPEIVPAKRSFWTVVSGFFTALGTTIYKGVEWLMGYQDQAERWGIFGYIEKVPGWVWSAVITGGFIAAVIFAYRTFKGIEKPVTTGERM